MAPSLMSGPLAKLTPLAELLSLEEWSLPHLDHSSMKFCNLIGPLEVY